MNLNFKDWLNEAFNFPLPIRWTKTSKMDWVGVFNVQGKKYIIQMMKEPQMPWEVKFELVAGKSRTQEITGTGDAALVFSTVLSGIQQWLNKVKPDAFAISAREPSRQSLYRRMLNMLPKKQWEIEDLGTTFFVQNRQMHPAYAGFSDNEFSDYY